MGGITHLASRLGVKDDPAFQAAYRKVFDQFFGNRNAETVRAMLLAKHTRADTGRGELDRVCFGLRQTMSWLAEAIEKRALTEIGVQPSVAAGRVGAKRARPVTARRTVRRPGSPSSR